MPCNIIIVPCQIFKRYFIILIALFQIEGVPDSGPGPHSGSVVVNPVINPSWSHVGAGNLNKPRLASRLSQMSLRSTVSDTELEQVVNSLYFNYCCNLFTAI